MPSGPGFPPSRVCCLILSATAHQPHALDFCKDECLRSQTKSLTQAGMEWVGVNVPGASFQEQTALFVSPFPRHLFLELDLCFFSPVLDTLLPALSMPVFLPVNNQHHGQKKVLMLALSLPGKSNSHIVDCHSPPQVRMFLFRNHV